MEARSFDCDLTPTIFLARFPLCSSASRCQIVWSNHGFGLGLPMIGFS
jgi:hypothetical protein